jgi:hypothetical protein
MILRGRRQRVRLREEMVWRGRYVVVGNLQKRKSRDMLGESSRRTVRQFIRRTFEFRDFLLCIRSRSACAYVCNVSVPDL